MRFLQAVFASLFGSMFAASGFSRPNCLKSLRLPTPACLLKPLRILALGCSKMHDVRGPVWEANLSLLPEARASANLVIFQATTPIFSDSTKFSGFCRLFDPVLLEALEILSYDLKWDYFI